MKMDDLKKVIAKLIRENFHQSISEATYDLGKKQYTEKNMTPTEILDLAMAYKSTPANKMLSGKLGNMVNVANDLAKLNGTTQLDAKTRGKNPALILFLLKNKLVTKEEYINLYKELLTKQISVIKSLKNADPASRMVSGAAARQAHKDMKGEFDESVVNEMSKNDVHFKAIMKMYDRGGSFTKKKVAVIVCRNSKASRHDIEEELLDTTYEDILQYQDELNIHESVKEAKSDYEVYHDSYTSAINAAKAYAEKKGYTINDDDSFRKIGMGPKKPSEGKTNKFSIELSKDDKIQKKQLHIQVYGMKTKYELNCYIG
jgi:hypothetical protein